MPVFVELCVEKHGKKTTMVYFTAIPIISLLDNRWRLNMQILDSVIQDFLTIIEKYFRSSNLRQFALIGKHITSPYCSNTI